MGRPKSDNPKDVAITFRVDLDTAEELERLIAKEKQPGSLISRISISRHEAARMLMQEGLRRRKKTPGRKKPGKKTPGRKIVLPRKL